MTLKIAVELTFVLAVLKQVAVKTVCVGGGKGICRVVNQFAQCIIIQMIPAAWLFQSGEDAAHIPLCVAEIVAPKKVLP